MPLTSKGKKIMKRMKKTYGAKKAKEIFYKMRNEKSIVGVDLESSIKKRLTNKHTMPKKKAKKKGDKKKK